MLGILILLARFNFNKLINGEAMIIAGASSILKIHGSKSIRRKTQILPENFQQVMVYCPIFTNSIFK